VGGSSSSGSSGGWIAFGQRDNRRLEKALQRGAAGPVPVDRGRYDVDLERRLLRAVYWDEPERRVIRSSWFHGRGSERVPYEEEDAEEIEAAFQRLRSGKERGPLLVPVNRGNHDVRFEALQPQDKQDENTLSALSFFMGSSSDTRHSVMANPPPAEGEAEEREEAQWTAVQESVARTGSQAAVPVWRGPAPVPTSPDELEDAHDDDLPEAVECLVFVVHGIGQYHRAVQGTTERFYKDVTKLRRLATRCLRQRLQEGLPVAGRLEFLPLEWFEPIHVDVGIGNRLKNVTLPSVAALRDFANFAIADIMVYLDDEWQERIHRELQRKMDRLWGLFRERTPRYTGEVAVIGHSLGAVIMFDLVQKSLPQLARGLLLDGAASPPGSPGPGHGARARASLRSQAALLLGDGPRCPAPRCFFAVGSPLGMFLSIRLSQRGQCAARYFRGLDVRWPVASIGRGWRFFNIFHPDDPIAYRVEPLLNPEYKDTPPKVVLHRGGLRFHHQMREWWQRTVGSTGGRGAGDAPVPSEAQTSTEASAAHVLIVPIVDAEASDTPAASFFEDGPGRPRQTAAVDRLDYAIQESAFESMSDLLSAIGSHFAYWDCEDLIQFIVDQLLDALEAKHREPPPREPREAGGPGPRASSRASSRTSVRRSAQGMP